MNLKQQISQRHFVSRVTMLLLIAFGFSLSLAAQNQPQLKVGDRVKDFYHDSAPGTVLEVGQSGQYKGWYRVRFDDDPKSQGGQGQWINAVGNNRLTLLEADNRPVAEHKATPGAAPKNPKKDDAREKNLNRKDDGEFHVGDRVEVISGGKWYPGTVTRGLEHNAYAVAMDKFVGQGLPDWQATPQTIRALKDGSKAPVAEAMPSQRKPIKCPEQKTARLGPPPTELAKTLIQCLWEDNGSPYGSVNFDLHSVQIGQPRPWREAWSGRDMGTGVPGTTLVYPVYGKWTMKTFKQSSVTIAEQEGVHNCYINPFGKWQCGAAGIKDVRPLRSIAKP